MTLTTSTSTSTRPKIAEPSDRVGVRRLLATGHTTFLLTVAVLGRLPLGMVPLALTRSALADGASFALASTLPAAWGTCAAISQPVLGRLADRRGQALPLLGTALLSSTAVLVLVSTSSRGPAALVLAAVIGLGTPPLEATLRALWAHPAVLPSRAHRRTAVAVDTGVQELVYLLGPLLVSVLAAAVAPDAALCTAGLLGLLGALAMANSRPSRNWTPPVRRRADWRGPLRVARLRRVLLGLAFLGAALGSLNIAAVAAAERHHLLWLDGALPAALSAGGIAAAAVFAHLGRASRPWRQLVLLSVGFTAAWLPLALLDPAGAWALATAALPGLFFLPLLAVASLLVQDLAPHGTDTEAVGWYLAAIGIGQAIGALFAGLANGSYLITTAAAALCALTLAAACPRTRRRHRRPWWQPAIDPAATARLRLPAHHH